MFLSLLFEISVYAYVNFEPQVQKKVHSFVRIREIRGKTNFTTFAPKRCMDEA